MVPCISYRDRCRKRGHRRTGEQPNGADAPDRLVWSCRRGARLIRNVRRTRVTKDKELQPDTQGVVSLRRRLLDGALAGLAGLLGFGIIHWFLLFPTLAVFPLGVPVVLVGGVALGWAHHELVKAGRPPLAGWRGVAAGFFILLPVTPSVVAGLVVGPVQQPITILALAFFLPAALGLLAGWRWTRRLRGAVACAAAPALPSLFVGGSFLSEEISPSATARALVTVLGALIAAGVVLGFREANAGHG